MNFNTKLKSFKKLTECPKTVVDSNKYYVSVEQVVRSREVTPPRHRVEPARVDEQYNRKWLFSINRKGKKETVMVKYKKAYIWWDFYLISRCVRLIAK